MRSIAVLITLFLAIGLVSSSGHKPAGEPVPPPAGRSLLFRSADLQPWDFPASVRANFDTRLHRHPTETILGPPGFWTEPSLRTHYQETLRLRYHPDLFPTPPPFEAWLKEQQLIRSINMLSDTIKLETKRHDVKQEALMLHEMQLGEQSILLRQLQIATAIRYAKLDPVWMRFEEAVYRYWGSFLAVSQGNEKDTHWRELMNYLNGLTKEIKEAEEEEKRWMQMGPERMALLKDAKLGQRVGKKGSWREIMVEKGDGQSSNPGRGQSVPEMVSTSSRLGESSRAELRSTTPRRWPNVPEIPSSSGGESVKRLREVFTKDLHI
ncbi:uncharacterized protein UTRI_04878 [Ustilago trichophora]|uniref:VPS37 C-terminal domain-containing protein n=1 Tax=Ustilago trichophora TaxID=86804 RepID=A0A5C3EG64_9BASI|nr:uncharacterized protein UTRI_04878 [Ustilago trichophora]